MVESKSILFVSESSTLLSSEIGAKIGAAYGEIMALMGVAKLETTSAPINTTRKFSLTEMMVEFDPAIIIDEMPVGLEVSGRVQKGETYAGKTLKTVHVGSYESLKSTYDKLIAYISQNGYEVNGDSWEEYIDDLTTVAPDELRTNIYFPVK
jgi:effector-binding domain-containing protein